VIVLDAYAVVALVGDEPAAGGVESLIRAGASMSAVNAAEVVDRVGRLYRGDGAASLQNLQRGGLSIVAFDEELAVDAGRLRREHYHRRTGAVSLADCACAATAARLVVPVATSDPALARMVMATGGSVHQLPDSNGTLPLA
jgi:PIN domain nuclease of toxin-antitoxin system